VTPQRLSVWCEVTNPTDRPCYLANRPPQPHCNRVKQEAYAEGPNGTWLLQSGDLLMLFGDAIVPSPSPFMWEFPALTKIAAGQRYSFTVELHAPVREYGGTLYDLSGQSYWHPRYRATSRLWLVADVSWPSDRLPREERVDGTDAVRLCSDSTATREQLVIDLPQPVLVDDPPDGTHRGDAHAQQIRGDDRGGMPVQMIMSPPSTFSR